MKSYLNKGKPSFNKLDLFKKSMQAIFFGETNPESLFQHQDGIKKKPREKGSLKK